MRYSAAHWKSVKQFCLLANIPAAQREQNNVVNKHCAGVQRPTMWGLRTFVPGLAVLPPASDVGHGQDPPHVPHEDEPRDAVAGRDGDVEAAVAVQEARVGAVQFDALLVHDEHGDLGAVLGRVEDLSQEEEQRRRRLGMWPRPWW